MSEVLNFKRRVGPRPSQSKRHSVTSITTSAPDTTTAYHNSPIESEYDFSDPEDAYHRHLLTEAEDKKPLFPDIQSISAPPSSSISPAETPPMEGMMFHSDRSPCYGDESSDEVSPGSNNFPLPPTTSFQQQQNFDNHYTNQYFHQPIQPLPSHQPYQHQYVPSSYDMSPSSTAQPNFSTIPNPAYTAPSPLYTGMSYWPVSAPIQDHGQDGKSGYMDMQVYQGHLRTRSMQSDPPIATFWSPNAYHGGGGGVNGHVSGWGSGNLVLGYPALANSPMDSPLPPQLQPSIPQPQPNQIQEGWVNCYTNEPMSPPPNPLGMVGARMASSTQAMSAGLGVDFNGPQSVPASFSPIAGDNYVDHNISNHQHHLTPQTDVMEERDDEHDVLGQPFQLRPTLHPRHDSFSSSLGYSPTTVSPGAYHDHHGSSPPINLLNRPISSPRYASSIILNHEISSSSPPKSPASANRQIRRLSLSSPYSQPQRQRPPLSLSQLSMSPPRGPFRGLGLGGVNVSVSDGYKSSTSTMNTPEMVIPDLPGRGIKEDRDGGGGMNGLPSAGIGKGFGDEAPFSTVLAGLSKGELTDGDEEGD